MSKTILIIDKEVGLRHFIEVALRKAGFQTQVADSGRNIITHLETSHVDAVILDDELEGISGGQLCRRIKQEHHTPVIIYSNSLRLQNPEYLSAIGADAILSKTASVDELVQTVNALVTCSYAG